jgi:hypothetical protein
MTQDTFSQTFTSSKFFVDSSNQATAKRHSMGEAERFRKRVLKGLEVNE